MILVYKEGVKNSERLMGEIQFKALAKDGWLEVPTTDNVDVTDESKKVDEVPTTDNVDVLVSSIPLTVPQVVAELRKLSDLKEFDLIAEFTKGDERAGVQKAIKRFTK